MEFGPDATFALDLRDDAAADAFLKEHTPGAGAVRLLRAAAAVDAVLGGSAARCRG